VAVRVHRLRIGWVFMMTYANETIKKPQGSLMADEIASPSKADSHKMFDRISSRYDLLNRILSLGIDSLWRRRLALMMREYSHRTVLDLACGTCDLVLSSFRRNPDIECGIGIDMAGRMLDIGKRKIHNRGLSNRISLSLGDGMELPLADRSIDFAMISFGIRNMVDPAKALAELRRVLTPDGHLAVLEFSIPENRIFRALYLLYFRKLLPLIGGIVSGDRFAYNYLNRTVETFYYGKAFCEMMRAAGFGDIRSRPLTFGIATIYIGSAG